MSADNPALSDVTEQM